MLTDTLSPMSKSARLSLLSDICLALPEATRELQGDHASFRVRKKVFAYFLNNHHGDGIVSICGKALPGDHTALVASDPVKFYLPAYIGPRGWVGLRLDIGRVDWEEVKELITGSYLQTAPRKLAALVKIPD
jgi:predicted DNA-binding protein (MmcQ/YjbR family)